MSENKVNFGLKNVHYATFEENAGVITYDTPISIPGAVELSLEPRGDMTEFYADDILYYSASNNQGYDGTLTIANTPEKFEEDVLGETKDSIDMVMTEKTTAKGKSIALMFEFDGDKKATRHVLYNCTVSRPKIGSSTKTDSVEPNTNELTFVSSPRSTDYAVKTKTTSTTPISVYDNWYTSVYQKASDTTPPTATVVPASNATSIPIDSNIVWTFDEEIRSTDVITSNFLVIDASGAEVAGSVTLDVTNKIVTFDPTASLTLNTRYTAIALKGIRDLAGNTLANNIITSFTTVTA